MHQHHHLALTRRHVIQLDRAAFNPALLNFHFYLIIFGLSGFSRPAFAEKVEY
jgi:hypothetical protein